VRACVRACLCVHGLRVWRKALRDASQLSDILPACNALHVVPAHEDASNAAHIQRHNAITPQVKFAASAANVAATTFC
jgi:hypothetical protein